MHKGTTMSDASRRDFIRQGSLGLATLGAAGWVLRADAAPTESSGELGNYAGYLQGERRLFRQQQRGAPQDFNQQGKGLNQRGNFAAPANFALTEDNILGPFYRGGAPYRAKITPPLVKGTALLVSGRVWSFKSREPLAGAVLDIWQADADGRYDNDDPANPPAKDVFKNRARLVTDENGYYEFETIHPGAYMIGKNAWRPSHIHYLVRAAGHKSLITQLYFKGDPHNKTDEFIKESLIIEVRREKAPGGFYEVGVFDIVLAPSTDPNLRR
jgi:catechol 1,2-dioxygenase